ARGGSLRASPSGAPPTRRRSPRRLRTPTPDGGARRLERRTRNSGSAPWRSSGFYTMRAVRPAHAAGRAAVRDSRSDPRLGARLGERALRAGFSVRATAPDDPPAGLQLPSVPRCDALALRALGRGHAPRRPRLRRLLPRPPVLGTRGPASLPHARPHGGALPRPRTCTVL